MDKKDIRRGLLGMVLVAELAVVDYCAWMMLMNGVTIEVVSDENES